MQNPEPAVPEAKSVKPEAPTTSVVTQHKVDYATDLFNLLSMDGSRETDAKTSTDTNTWVNFECIFLSLMILINKLLLLWYIFPFLGFSLKWFFSKS